MAQRSNLDDISLAAERSQRGVERMQLDDLSQIHPVILFSIAVITVAALHYIISVIFAATKKGAVPPQGTLNHAPDMRKKMVQKYSANFVGADIDVPPSCAASSTINRTASQDMWHSHKVVVGRSAEDDARQKRIRQIMTGRAESPVRSSGGEKREMEKDSPSPLNLRLKKTGFRPRPDPLNLGLQARITRTGSGVRSAEGAVDTPISSPMSSPRRSSSISSFLPGLGGEDPLSSPLSSAIPAFKRTGSSHFFPRVGSAVFDALAEDDMAFPAPVEDGKVVRTPTSVVRTPSAITPYTRSSSTSVRCDAASAADIDILQELRGTLDVTLARGSYFREDESKSDCSSLHEGSVDSAGDRFGDKVPVSGVFRSSEVSLDRTPSASFFDRTASVEKDTLRGETDEEFEERRGRANRPKTLYWAKKNWSKGNMILRGTESPTRDLSPVRGGYEIVERSVSPVRQPRGWKGPPPL